MAIDVTIDTTIARPPETVFGRIADIDAWPSWLIASGIVSVTRASTDPIQPGERLTVDQRAAGRSGTFDAEVTALEPGRRLTLRGRDEDGVTIDIEATVAKADPSQPTGTALRWSIRIGLPSANRVFDRWLAPR